MGINIWIGEAVLVPSASASGLAVEVEAENPHSGGIKASYITWSDAIRKSGLADLFPQPGPCDLFLDTLIPTHPGVAYLKPEHLREIERGMKRYFDRGYKDPEEISILVFLVTEITWSLKNCRIPVIQNG